MSRAKLTAYLNHDLADAVRRMAAHQDRSASDVVEDAVARFFGSAHREGEHHAVMERLNRIVSRLNAIERNQEALFELCCHAARFAMSIAPDIPERDRTAVNVRGSERFGNVIAAMIAKLGAGRSVWREHFGSPNGAGTSDQSCSVSAE
jgi:hypothetical protein